MNVTVIYGTMRKSITHDCVKLFLDVLKRSVDVKANEFFLPQELTNFSNQSFSYAIGDNENNNYFYYLNSIAKSLEESDLIILACPVCSCDISAEMKSFLDYLSNRFIKNKTNYSMYDKIAVVISTSSGAGLFYTNKILKKRLNFLGIKNTFKFSKIIYEMNWEYITLKAKTQIYKDMFKLSNKISDLHNNLHATNQKLFTKMPFTEVNPTFKSNDLNVIDLNCWKNNKYIHGKNI